MLNLDLKTKSWLLRNGSDWITKLFHLHIYSEMCSHILPLILPIKLPSLNTAQDDQRSHKRDNRQSTIKFSSHDSIRHFPQAD